MQWSYYQMPKEMISSLPIIPSTSNIVIIPIFVLATAFIKEAFDISAGD